MTEHVKKLNYLIQLAVLVVLATPVANAQLEIEIISGNPSALPIAIVPFE